MNEVDMNAIALGRLLAEADRAHLQAAARPVEPDVAGDCGNENHEERNRDKADARLKEVHEIVADHSEEAKAADKARFPEPRSAWRWW